jgi:hypothetical protein
MRIPLEAISKIVEHLEDHGELRDYCVAIRNGNGQDHIYRHIRNVQYWLANRHEDNARADLARARYETAHKQISEAVAARMRTMEARVAAAE